MRKLIFVLFCTTALFFNSCKNYEDFKEIDTVNYDPEFAAPLITTSLSLEEMMGDELSFLDIAPDGSMSFNYTQEQVQKEASELISELEDFPIALIDSAMSVPVQLFDNLNISKLSLKNGTLSFEAQSSYTEDIELKIIFPGMTKNGSSFEVQTMIEYQGTTPTTTTINPESIQGFDLALSGGNLEIQYEAYTSSGNRVLLDLITGEAKDWEYNSIEGVWAQESFPLDMDTIEVELFQEGFDGDISFHDPKLILNLSNSIGFPMQLKIENLIAHTADGTAIPLTSVLNEGYNLSYPTLTEMGQEKTDQIVLDKNNSNIISVFNSRPRYITYEVVAIMNPEETNDIGFIAENSKISGSLVLDLPIYGTASGFTFESKTAFEITEDLEEFSYAEFKLITDNGIPADLEMQLYFTDENDNIIDSLFEDQRSILAAPIAGANGSVISSAEAVNLIDISAERLTQIKTAKFIKAKAVVSTINDGTVPVKILSSQKIDLRLGAIFGLEN